MKPLAYIVFTVMSGPDAGLQREFVERQPCTAEILEETLNQLDDAGWPSMAQCYYGNGPQTSPRPVARPVQ